MTLLSYFGLHGVTSSLPILVLVCDSFLSALRIVIFSSVSTYRYVAYRQYTYWIHKKLGRKIRIAIPSCVVKKIRESFPSESGSYRGFEYAH